MNKCDICECNIFGLTTKVHSFYLGDKHFEYEICLDCNKDFLEAYELFCLEYFKKTAKTDSTRK